MKLLSYLSLSTSRFWRGGKSFTDIQEYKDATWFDIRKLNHNPEPLLAKLLDEGEASVIHLAWESGIQKTLWTREKAVV